MIKGRLFLGLPLLLILATGCGVKNPNAPAQVSGTVRYKDQLVKAGTVQFHIKEAGQYRSNIQRDGTYSITDMPVGDVVVTVETESVSPDKKLPVYGGGGKASPQMQQAPPGAYTGKEDYVKIPSKYADEKSSPLKLTLKAGSQTHNFDLAD